MRKHTIHSQKSKIKIFEQLNVYILEVAMYTHYISFFKTEVKDDFIKLKNVC